MLVYTIQAAFESSVAERVVVSTDSLEISNVAKQNGAQVIDRPAEISTGESSTESALLHALDVMKEDGFRPDWILTLQPTSPLRSAQTIRDFVSAYREVSERFDSMLSVSQDYGFKWVMGDDGCLQPLFQTAQRRRQDREPLYEEDSALYVTGAEALRRTGSIFGASVTGFLINPMEAVDINEPIDLLWAEFLLGIRESDAA